MDVGFSLVKRIVSNLTILLFIAIHVNRSYVCVNSHMKFTAQFECCEELLSVRLTPEAVHSN